jgi:hypothetical protein
MRTVLCTCIAYGCRNQTDYRPDTREVVQGQFLDPRVRKVHMRMDEGPDSRSGQSNHETVEEMVFQVASTSAPDTDPIVNARAHPAHFQAAGHTNTFIPTSDASNATPSPGFNELRTYRSRFSELEASFQQPTSLEFRPGVFTSRVPPLEYTAASKAFLQHQEIITQLLVLVDSVDSAGVEEVRQMRKDLVADIQAHLHHLDSLVEHMWETQQYHDGLQQISGQMLVYDNREWDPSCSFELGQTISLGSNFKGVSKLLELPSPLVAALFVVITVNLLAGTSRHVSGFLLSAFYFVVYTTFEYFKHRLRPTSPSFRMEASDPLLKPTSWPQDLRTAMKEFDVDPNLVLFACCPKCSYTYPPSPEGTYPLRCTHREFPGSEECGSEVAILKGGKTSPVRRFYYQPVNSWLGRMLSRPGIEELMDDTCDSSSTSGRTGGIMRDVWDGLVLQTMKGPGGSSLFSQRVNGEARLVFSLFVDWFNPFGNKISGKHVSMGAIYMVCLNLPTHLRYRLENVYLVGIIPGPTEPKLHEINHFLRPLVDDFQKLWNPGVFFTCTSAFPLGRLVRAIIGPLVADLPASRKVAGFLGHGANLFCSFCQLPSFNICNFDKSTWKRHTWEDHIRYATAWRNAGSLSTREAIAKAYGVRWSQLLELEYWNPLIFATLDSMHNLFLGDLQNHVRSVWGVDAVKSTDDKVQKNQKPHSEEEQRGELERVVQALSRNSSQVTVRKGYVVAIAQVNNVKLEGCVTKDDHWQALRNWVGRLSFVCFCYLYNLSLVRRNESHSPRVLEAEHHSTTTQPRTNVSFHR